jgi:hypothetical protein
MINSDEIVQKEKMSDVILFVVRLQESGISYPALDRFFGNHKASIWYESYNTDLIYETRKLEENGEIYSGKTYMYKKGPKWKQPDFVKQKKYGIE